MPPIRKTDMDRPKTNSKPYLSKSLGGASLKTSFDESTKVNLSSSCFGAIRTEKGDPDDDLTSLNWLQNNDILKGFEVSATVPPVSPTRDVNGDIFDTPPREGQAKGPVSTDALTNKRKSPSKPPYSFSSLIFMAIEEAPMKRLPVKDIYSWIMEHFPYFRDARLGWKNSVRHNLSLNKCFKKVDKDKGQFYPQNIGKGSLWTVDPDYRPNLLQALRKTPSLHPYHHMLTTPPPSPKSLGADGLPGINTGKIEVDPDAEAEAVATICMISTPPALRVAEMVRCQSCPPSETDREELLVKRAKEFYYRHRRSFSGAVSMAKYKSPSLLIDSQKRYHKRSSLSSSLNKIDSVRMKQNISPDSSLDGEFEFDHHVDSDEDDDSEIEETMKRVVKDELSDSGYGQGIEDEIDRKKGGKSDKTVPRHRRGRRDSTTEKLNAIAGADALLELANSAFIPSPRPSSTSTSPVPQCSTTMVS
ncbi:forkhead box protein N3-like isoform X1 [Montipora capricornis]|uniref:forkhead box protein N3-like isoform X1 n=1 Tax=Montipora capricornis TaxID=246305 RepID=UPI0035F2009F